VLPSCIARSSLAFQAGAAMARQTRKPQEKPMAFSVQHVHLKCGDPKKTAQFYIDNFGATMKRDIPGRGCQLDLHGLQLNVTTIVDTQNHEQHLGIEHIACRLMTTPGR